MKMYIKPLLSPPTHLEVHPIRLLHEKPSVVLNAVKSTILGTFTGHPVAQYPERMLCALLPVNHQI